MGQVKQLHDKIAELAQRDFADHVIREKSNPGDYARVFWCGKPDGSSIMHFKVVVFPGYLMVTGDVGDIVLFRDTDMIAWCRSAVRSPSYFFEKATMSREQKRCWTDEAFEDWLTDAIEQDKRAVEDGDYDEVIWSEQRVKEVREAASSYDRRPEEAVYEKLTELGLSDCYEDIDACYDFTPNCWWSLECVKKFLSLYDAMQKVAA